MRIFHSHRFIAFLGLVLAVFLSSCERERIKDVIVDQLIYGIDTIPVYASAADKDKQKTTTQFLSTAYTQLYLRPIPSGMLNELTLLRLSHGDKQGIGELIISHFLQSETVQSNMPSEEEMWIDLDVFVRQTYLRFYLRLPSAYEQYALKRSIEEDDETRVVDVYRAFLLSDEYLFY